MFSTVITIIYIRCILCTTSTERALLTETSSAGITEITPVSTAYSTLTTASTSPQNVASNTNSPQRQSNNIQTTLSPHEFNRWDHRHNMCINNRYYIGNEVNVRRRYNRFYQYVTIASKQYYNNCVPIYDNRNQHTNKRIFYYCKFH
jgi:hypothetical protein